MKRWSSPNKNFTDPSGRWVYALTPHADPEEGPGGSAMSLDVREAQEGIEAELSQLSLEMEVTRLEAQIQDPQNRALQLSYLQGKPIADTQLEFTENLDPEVKQQVLDHFNQLPFRARYDLVSPEAIASFIQADTQNAIIQFSRHTTLLNQLSTESQLTLLSALSQHALPSNRATILTQLPAEVVTNFVLSHPREAVTLFSITPQALEEQSIVVKFELMTALVSIDDELICSDLINALPEADLVRFISTEPDIIAELCTVEEGDWIRVNFYDNPILNREVSPAILFPDADFIHAYSNRATYRNTAYGFRAFHQRTATLSRAIDDNEKAFADDGDYFQVLTESDLTPQQRAALDEAEPLEPPEQSIHYEMNQAYALNYKILVENMITGLPDTGLSDTQRTDIKSQAQAFRIFLDGRRFLLEGEQPDSVSYTNSVLAGLPVIDYNAPPQEVQQQVETALGLMMDHFMQEIAVLNQRAQDENLSEAERAEAQAQVDAYTAMMERSGQDVHLVLERIRVESAEIRDYNLSNVNDALSELGLEETQIREWWEQLNQAETLAARNEVLVTIRARLETLLRAQGVEDPSTAADELMFRFNQQIIYDANAYQGVILTENLRRGQQRMDFRSQRIAPTLALFQELGIPVDPAILSALQNPNYTAADVALLEQFVQTHADTLNAYINSPGADGENLSGINAFLSGTAHQEFRDQMAGVNTEIEQNVTAADHGLGLIEAQVEAAEAISEFFTPNRERRTDTPETLQYWDTNDQIAAEVQTYFEEHGELPPPEIEQQMYRAVLERNPTPQNLMVQDPVFQNAPVETQVVLYSNLSQLPPQANFVGVTADGHYILESGSETDQTRYLQDPLTGEIIPERYAGLPDAEDLKTTNWYLAQVYAAFTAGSVTDFPLRDLTQDAERGGATATSTYMENLLIAMNRSSDHTFTPNEFNQWTQVGELSREYGIGLDEVFARLAGGRRPDNTINPGQAGDASTRLIPLLEAAVVGNRARFEAILGLNPPTV